MGQVESRPYIIPATVTDAASESTQCSRKLSMLPGLSLPEPTSLALYTAWSGAVGSQRKESSWTLEVMMSQESQRRATMASTIEVRMEGMAEGSS